MSALARALHLHLFSAVRGPFNGVRQSGIVRSPLNVSQAQRGRVHD